MSLFFHLKIKIYFIMSFEMFSFTHVNADGLDGPAGPVLPGLGLQVVVGLPIAGN